MNLSIKKFCISLLCLGLVWHTVSATKIDGTTAVVLKTTPYDFTGDSGAIGADGAVWFQEGFILHGSNDTEIDVAFPVNGAISLNSGTLSLLHDVRLGSDVTIAGTGSIKGNDAEDRTIYLGNDLTYSTNTLTVATSTIIDGENHHFTLAAGGTLSVVAGKTLTLKNMDLIFEDDVTLTMGAGSTLILDNVRWHLEDDFTFSAGALEFKKQCSIDAPSQTVFTYSSSSALTINKNSFLTLENGLIYKQTSSAPFTFVDATAKLKLQGATFWHALASNTLELKTGTLWVEHHSYMKTSETGCIINLGHATQDLSIEFMPAASLDISAGSVTYANAS